jgi:endonuclease/exonuclease/phosphatase (EEP) superfamily protein YafD
LCGDRTSLIIGREPGFAFGVRRRIEPGRLVSFRAASVPVCDHEPVPSRHIEGAAAGALAGWAAARLAGADRLRFAEAWAVPLLSFTPQVTAAAWVSAVVLRRNGPAAAAALAAAALTAAVGPRALRSRQPATSGPVLRVLTANLLAGRAAAGAVVELADRLQADVLFVQELTSRAAASLQQAGLADLLGHQVTLPMARGTRGSGIYARHPLSGGPPGPLFSAARCTARIDLPSGQPVRLVCVHTPAPKPPSVPQAAARWRTELAALPPAGDGDVPVLLAGDFNATLDHAQFRRLLQAGHADAASQAGHGLALTWGPRAARRPALLAIDHVLADRRWAVLTTSAHRLTGTDHLALYAELRLPAPGSQRASPARAGAR